jgi:hypothetical protein
VTVRLIAALIVFNLAAGATAQQTEHASIVPLAGSNEFALVDGKIVEYDPEHSEFKDYGLTQHVEVIDLWKGEKPRVVVGAVASRRRGPPAADQVPKQRESDNRYRSWGASRVYLLDNHRFETNRFDRHRKGRHRRGKAKGRAKGGWVVKAPGANRRAR